MKKKVSTVTDHFRRTSEEIKLLENIHQLMSKESLTYDEMNSRDEAYSRLGELQNASFQVHKSIQNVIASSTNSMKYLVTVNREQMIDDLIDYLKIEKKLLRKEASHA